jgi:hypothetical protein
MKVLQKPHCSLGVESPTLAFSSCQTTARLFTTTPPHSLGISLQQYRHTPTPPTMTENGQDKDVIWHDRPSITKYLERGNSRQELAVLAKEEPWKEMDLLSLRDSYQTIKDNLIFFLEKSVAEKHIKSISITLQESDSGDEVDDHDDDDEDEYEDEDEDE